jgi:chaperonin GroEL
VLAQAIVEEGLKNVTAGANPMDLKRGIDAAVQDTIKFLQKMSKKVADKSEIAR